MEKLRMAVLNAVVPVTKKIGALHMPFTHKKVTGRHVFSVIPHLKPGAVFVTRVRGEMSNLLIPGEFTHAGMCVASGVSESACSLFPSSLVPVVEAVGRGVVETDLISFMTSKDRVLLLYPTFASDIQMQKAADFVYQAIGTPYDYYFSPGSKAFYCSELCQHGYEISLGQDVTFSKRETLGVRTVLPQDFVNAKEKWHVVWDSDTALPPVK